MIIESLTWRKEKSFSGFFPPSLLWIFFLFHGTVGLVDMFLYTRQRYSGEGLVNLSPVNLNYTERVRCKSEKCTFVVNCIILLLCDPTQNILFFFFKFMWDQ